MNEKIAKLNLEQIAEGDSFSFAEVLSEDMLDRFAALSQDTSPLHMEKSFAQGRGFAGRVVHGALLVALFSRLVGKFIPGENGLLQSLTAHFLLPAYPGDHVLVKGIVDQVSAATRTIVLKATIETIPGGKILTKAKIQIGFTQEQK